MGAECFGRKNVGVYVTHKNYETVHQNISLVASDSSYPDSVEKWAHNVWRIISLFYKFFHRSHHNKYLDNILPE